MTHTAELFTEISSSEYFSLLSHPYGKWYTLEKHISPVFHIKALGKYGITDIKLHNIKTTLDFSIYYCSIIVNLQRLVDEKRSVKTYNNEKDFKLLESNFKKLITPLLPSRTDINNWIVKRIDYNIDLKMKQKEVEQYITLLQRGDKRYNWSIHKLKKQVTNKHPKGSVLFDNEQYSVNIYNKYLERKSNQERRGITDKKELEESKGILRIEVQLKSKKIKDIKKKIPRIREGRTLADFARFDIAIPVIVETLKNIAGQADYLSYSKALERINQELNRSATKKDIEHFLSLVSRFRSLWKAKKAYIANSQCKTSLDTVLKNLKKLNINPVTIPKAFKTDSIENLLNRTMLEFAEQWNKGNLKDF